MSSRTPATTAKTAFQRRGFWSSSGNGAATATPAAASSPQTASTVATARPSLFSPPRAGNSNPCHITRAVQALSDFHRNPSALSSFRAVLPSSVSGMRVFMFWSGVAGFVAMEIYQKRRLGERNLVYVEAYHGERGMKAADAHMAARRRLFATK